MTTALVNVTGKKRGVKKAIGRALFVGVLVIPSAVALYRDGPHFYDHAETGATLNTIRLSDDFAKDHGSDCLVDDPCSATIWMRGARQSG